MWAIGLETFLLCEDPWRIFLTTDHPNGAPFYTYPHLIRLLMDRSFRKEMMLKVNPDALKYSTLPNLEREYSLYEVAIMTRAGPARSLGLKDIGHLGVGASADITVYTDNADREAMFTTPDYVFKMDHGTLVPAGGSDFNSEIMVDTDLEQDIWVQAAEVRGNFNVVHHNVVSVIGPDGVYARTGRLASAVPGKQWDRFPVGSGKLIEAGSTLSFGLHYHPSNEPVVDTSSVAVWLVRDEITHELHSSVVADADLKIPPFESNYESRGEFVFETDAEITLFKPHMHYRGKDMLFRVVYPNGTKRTLLSVPNYDMNWQISYEFAQPVPVPMGTRLEVISHFDNSTGNPWNPNPSVAVLWGQDSRDEMMEGWFDYHVELEEPIVPDRVEQVWSVGP
ncbi:MAG TPA: hypothetical protein EYQ64_07820, partial [Gemmatimonadetes bacterium]|nr:hypothetical protein [Gemmatimonadota bacterium]